MDKSIEEILKTEYSNRFDELRKCAMATSFYKYGPVKTDYQVEKIIDAIESLKIRLEEYERTGNTEFLVDVANFAMIEFMYPRHPNAHYRATSSEESPGIAGFGINSIRYFDERERRF